MFDINVRKSTPSQILGRAGYILRLFFGVLAPPWVIQRDDGVVVPRGAHPGERLPLHGVRVEHVAGVRLVILRVDASVRAEAAADDGAPLANELWS